MVECHAMGMFVTWQDSGCLGIAGSIHIYKSESANARRAIQTWSSQNLYMLIYRDIGERDTVYRQRSCFIIV